MQIKSVPKLLLYSSSGPPFYHANAEHSSGYVWQREIQNRTILKQEAIFLSLQHWASSMGIPHDGFFLLLVCTNPPQFKKAPSKGHSLQKFCFLTVKKKCNCNSQALMVHYINQYPIVDDFLYSQYLSALQCIENVRRNYQMFITLRQDFTVLIFLRLRSGSPKLSL